MDTVAHDGRREVCVVGAGWRADLGEDDDAVAIGGDDVEPAVVAAAVAGLAVDVDERGHGGRVCGEVGGVQDGDLPPDAGLLLAVGEGQAGLQGVAALGGSDELGGGG